MPYKDPERRRTYLRDWQRKRRNQYRDGDRCTECGAIDGRILGGRNWCWSCYNKWYARRGKYLDIVEWKLVPLEVPQ